jgi:hypothetical protein
MRRRLVTGVRVPRAAAIRRAVDTDAHVLGNGLQTCDVAVGLDVDADTGRRRMSGRRSSSQSVGRRLPNSAIRSIHSSSSRSAHNRTTFLV